MKSEKKNLNYSGLLFIATLIFLAVLIVCEQLNFINSYIAIKIIKIYFGIILIIQGFWGVTKQNYKYGTFDYIPFKNLNAIFLGILSIIIGGIIFFWGIFDSGL